MTTGTVLLPLASTVLHVDLLHLVQEPVKKMWRKKEKKKKKEKKLYEEVIC